MEQSVIGLQERLIMAASATLTFMALLFSALFFVATGITPLTIVCAAGAVGFLAVPVVVRAGHPIAAGWLLSLVIYAAMLVGSLLSQGFGVHGWVWFSAIPLAATFLVGPRGGAVLCAMVCAAAVGLFVLEHSVGWPFPWNYPRWILWASDLISSTCGTIYITGIGMLYHHTNRRQMAMLDNAHQRLETVLDSTDQAVFTVLSGGVPEPRNRTATQLQRSVGTERWGQFVSEILHSRSRSASGRPVFRQTASTSCCDGTQRVFAIVIHPFADGTSQSALFVSDVTELHAAQQERDRLQEELVETSRQAGMAEIASGVLHNVGNLLNSVNISATEALSQLSEDNSEGVSKITGLMRARAGDLPSLVSEKGPQMLAYLDGTATRLQRDRGHLRAKLERMCACIDDVKAIIRTQQHYARNATDIKQHIDLLELVQDLITIFEPRFARDGVQLKLEYVERLSVLAHRHQITQIINNLVANALDATVGHVAEPTLSVRLERDGDDAVLRISDNGIGIDEQLQARIFTHGFTTKSSGHGFGLHSSLILARSLGGDLLFVSRGAGRGACFALRCPVAEPPEPLQLDNYGYVLMADRVAGPGSRERGWPKSTPPVTPPGSPAVVRAGVRRPEPVNPARSERKQR